MNALLRMMLKGSAVSALALTMAAVGCSDADKETETGAGGEDGGGKGGTPSTGGSSTDKGGEGGAGATTPGGADAGGAEAGGAEAGGAEAGGAGGADAGGLSVAKFCNNLTFGTEANPLDTTLILEVGEGAEKVTFTAKTGECVPADGDACKPIPLGPAVAVALLDADDAGTVLYNGEIDSADGDKWIFNTNLEVVEEVTVACEEPPCTFPIAEGGTVKDEFTCEEITYDDVFPPE